MGPQKASRLEPRVVRGGRHAGPPLDPQAQLAREAAALAVRVSHELCLDESITLAFSSRARVLAWSREANALAR
jgi:hypothetical protein